MAVDGVEGCRNQRRNRKVEKGREKGGRYGEEVIGD